MGDKKADDKAARRQAALAGDDPSQVGAGTMQSTGRGRRPAESQRPMAVDHEQLGAAVAAALGLQGRQRMLTEPTPNLDRTVPGGCYIVDGVVVNAHGERCELTTGDADEAADDWIDDQAEVHAPAIAQANIEAAKAEQAAAAEPTEDQRKAAEMNQARLDAADEVRKRAEEAAQQLTNPSKDKDAPDRAGSKAKGKE